VVDGGHYARPAPADVYQSTMITLTGINHARRSQRKRPKGLLASGKGNKRTDTITENKKVKSATPGIEKVNTTTAKRNESNH
jgi:hypothetical protein